VAVLPREPTSNRLPAFSTANRIRFARACCGRILRGPQLAGKGGAEESDPLRCPDARTGRDCLRDPGRVAAKEFHIIHKAV
jgi:hypothetical protein